MGGAVCIGLFQRYLTKAHSCTNELNKTLFLSIKKEMTMSELNEAQKVAWAGFVAGDWQEKRQRA